MRALHRAALVRAYRTLAQGLGGSAVASALTAVIAAAAGGQPVTTAAIAAAGALGATLVAAGTSFWQGVARGLPEVPDDEPPAVVQASSTTATTVATSSGAVSTYPPARL